MRGGREMPGEIQWHVCLVIYDKLENTLFVAETDLVKPLYYYLDQNYFVFSSELRPLLASGFVKKEISSKDCWNF
jgi:asparagine synthase (glutamine-hydrolysing)